MAFQSQVGLPYPHASDSVNTGHLPHVQDIDRGTSQELAAEGMEVNRITPEFQQGFMDCQDNGKASLARRTVNGVPSYGGEA